MVGFHTVAAQAGQGIFGQRKSDSSQLGNQELVLCSAGCFIYSCGFFAKGEVDFVLRGHLVMSVDISGCHNRREMVCCWHFVGRGQGRCLTS